MNDNVSATGTGKSLSIICGALTWLKHHEQKRIDDLKEKLEAKSADGNEAAEDPDDWIAAASKKMEEQDQKREIKMELDFLIQKEEKIRELKRRRQTIQRSEVQKVDADFDELFKDAKEVQDAVRKELSAMKSGIDPADQEHILDDYLSDDEDGDADDRFLDLEEEKQDYSLRVRKPRYFGSQFHKSVFQIYFCSRTHSQLSQFVKEVQKTKFAEDIRLVSLASRANMCINESVKKLQGSSLINEKCLELQKKKSKTTAKDENSRPVKRQRNKSGSSCPFYKSAAINDLRDQALLEVQDIEQLVNTGLEMKACPYYASRKAVEDAQVVVVPYNTLLHKSTREICGLQLKGSVVIVDEAHNLLDTISHIHSSEVTSVHLSQAKAQLTAYLKRYKAHLKAKNLLYVKQISFILNKLLAILESKSSSAAAKLVDRADFLIEAEVFNINLYKLIRYMEKSRISHKLQGFSKHIKDEDANKPKEVKKGVSAFLKTLGNSSTSADKNSEATEKSDPTSTNSPLLLILGFLQALSNTKSDLRVLVDPGKKLKVVLLNPASQFTDLVKECRSIIVAGGTMQPVSEFRDQLFVSAGGDADNVKHFACGHVVTGDKVLPIVIKSGPTGKKLDFSFQFRDLGDTMAELSRTLINVCNIVPGGVVVFFPSYDYESR